MMINSGGGGGVTLKSESERFRKSRLRICFGFTLLAILVACHDSLPLVPRDESPSESPSRLSGALANIFGGTTPPEASEFYDRWIGSDPRECVNGLLLHQDSVTPDGEQLACSVTMIATGTDSLSYLLEHNQAIGATAPILLSFSAPVTDVVIIRYGATPCAVSSFGGTSGFAGDSLLTTRDFSVRPPCEQWIPVLRSQTSRSTVADRNRSLPVSAAVQGHVGKTSSPPVVANAYEDFPYITQWSEVSYTGVSGITRIRIDPSLPWSFFSGLDTTARNAKYTVMYRVASPSNTGFQVHCSPENVIRAETVSCIARQGEGAAPTTVHWEFRSNDTLAPGYQYSEVRDSLWRGPLLVSGWIVARAGSASAPSVDSTLVSAVARDWSSQFPVEFTISEVKSQYADPAAADSQLGYQTSRVRYLSEPVTAAEGPNSGMYYYDSFPYAIDFNVALHRLSMRRQSKFWRMQPFARTVRDSVVYCPRVRVVSDTVGVKAHEGFKITDVNSHTEVYYRSFSTFFLRRGEGMVSATGLFQPILDSATAQADSLSLSVPHDSATNPWKPGCRFNYDQRRFP